MRLLFWGGHEKRKMASDEEILRRLQAIRAALVAATPAPTYNMPPHALTHMRHASSSAFRTAVLKELDMIRSQVAARDYLAPKKSKKVRFLPASPGKSKSRHVSKRRR